MPNALDSLRSLRAISRGGALSAFARRFTAGRALFAGDDARDIFLIQQLEQILTKVTDRVQNLEIGEVTILDGGDGRALPGHLAALPATVSAVLKEFRETTGVDVTGILTGNEEVSR